MKFALLGADAESLALADAAEGGGHTLAWREDPATAERGDWEDLFDPNTADAVIVGAGGGNADLRARQAQELAKLGRSLLAVHPLVPAVISYFEIDMARGESGAVLQHFNPLVESTFVERVVSWSRGGHPELGAVEQIAATRMLGDRSQERVVWHFSRDVELLARLAGRFDRVGAHAAMGDPETAYASLGVQLLGARPIPVRWSIEPLASRPELRVVAICERGRLTLVFDEHDHCVELIEQSGGGEVRTPTADDSPEASAVARFFVAVNRGNGAASTWTAALDAMELADSIEISLRRGRMIDVHHRELTEQLAFKGVMSALGCGVLVVLIPLLIVVGWIAGILNVPLSETWPHLLLAALAAFLALQLVPKLMARATVRTASDAKAPTADGEPTPGESNSTD